MKQFVISAFLTNFLSGAIKQVLLYLILQELLVCLFTVNAGRSEPYVMSPGECEEAEVMDVSHVYIFSSLISPFITCNPSLTSDFKQVKRPGENVKNVGVGHKNVPD